ncbi:MAG TPA: hypothetical protein P5230_03275 [Candidatus Magasanikbacteria bacterium]|nr:hypothetical protein [Candidatus Magasanikbacteria bacterium]
MKKYLNKLIRVQRESGCGNYNTDGILLAENKNFLLIANEREMQIDGYTVINKKFVKRVYASKSRDFVLKMMKKEGQLKKIKNKIKLGDTMWEIFKQIKKYYGAVIIENERKDIFILGTLKNIFDKGVEVNHIDAEGKYWKKSRMIEYEKINLITWDCRYLNYYVKYGKTV